MIASGHLSPVITSLLLLALVFVLDKIARNRWSLRWRYRYPPGPPQQLMTGNRIAQGKPWLNYTEMARSYGPIVHLQVLHQHIIIINSEEVAVDLLEYRSSLYSDRPWIPMADLMNWSFATSLQPYSDIWRRHRRIFHQYFNSRASVVYQETEMLKLRDTLREIASNSQNIENPFRKLASGIIMSTMYGYEVESLEDEYVTLVDQAVNMLGAALFPGSMVVNSIPFLRHIPAWFPGANFKRFAAKCAVLTNQMLNMPFDVVKERLANKESHVPCLASKLLLQSSPISQEQEAIYKAVLATSYIGASDTTPCALMNFVLAMVLHPQVVSLAHAELDRVLEGTRLPTFEDRSSLPYIEAIYREVMRWRPVSPLPPPRAVIVDDLYKGYFIPKGSTVLINLWAMSMDESKYPEPHVFRPERFLTDDGQLKANDRILAYGFGRRICPGRHMADATVWATIAAMLTVFDITKARDKFGNEIPVPEYSYSDTFVSYPKPFKYNIRPRSAHFEYLIHEKEDRDA